MSNLIATKRVDLLAPYLALDQGSRVQAECELAVFPLRLGTPLKGDWTVRDMELINQISGLTVMEVFDVRL